jgi:hypothetical protein
MSDLIDDPGESQGLAELHPPLIEFLLAQIANDEATARAARSGGRERREHDPAVATSVPDLRRRRRAVGGLRRAETDIFRPGWLTRWLTNG